MKTIFDSVGLPPSIQKVVAEVCDTCRECRAWTKPKPEVQPSLTVSTRVCQHGELDLMFYRDYIIFHIMDRCTRFHTGDEAKDKSEDTLIELYELTWCKHFGPFEILYVDGESGLTNKNARARLLRLGTTVQPRAPE